MQRDRFESSLNAGICDQRCCLSVKSRRITPEGARGLTSPAQEDNLCDSAGRLVRSGNFDFMLDIDVRHRTCAGVIVVANVQDRSIGNIR
ncbi:MAG: hypothetical protein JWP89_5401 [Schlesneria sp.]|nr:hypothetical protein [Schlesneria sp.]